MIVVTYIYIFSKIQNIIGYFHENSSDNFIMKITDISFRRGQNLRTRLHIKHVLVPSVAILGWSYFIGEFGLVTHLFKELILKSSNMIQKYHIAFNYEIQKFFISRSPKIL